MLLSSLVKTIFKAFFAAAPYRLISGFYTDIAENMTVFCESGCQVQGRVIVIRIHTGIAIQSLCQDHDRNRQVFQPFFVFGSEQGSDQNDAVHILVMEGIQVAQLLLDIIVGAGQQALVARLSDAPGDASDHFSNRVRIDLWNNNANKVGFPAAERLGRVRWVVSGFPDDLSDSFALLRTDIALV